ncbi:MAG: hypothetical protein IAI49_02405, partial [Candidatus Eremiobacteraeota bacterium]|nr:hypothetical protein [Candidatus Eremiobacteraeota bacterium]
MLQWTAVEEEMGKLRESLAEKDAEIERLAAALEKARAARKRAIDAGDRLYDQAVRFKLLAESRKVSDAQRTRMECALWDYDARRFAARSAFIDR